MPPPVYTERFVFTNQTLQSGPVSLPVPPVGYQWIVTDINAYANENVAVNMLLQIGLYTEDTPPVFSPLILLHDSELALPGRDQWTGRLVIYHTDSWAYNDVSIGTDCNLVICGYQLSTP